MECRELKLTLVSANNLPDIRVFGRMKVYAEVSIKGESRTSKKTPTDTRRNTKPRWDFTVKYIIIESVLQRPDINLSIELFCERTLAEDKYIGLVNVSIKSLYDKGMKADGILSYRVSGTKRGTLHILYSFGDKFVVQMPCSRSELASQILVEGSRSEMGSESRSSWRNFVADVGLLMILGAATLLLSDDDDDVRDVDVAGKGFTDHAPSPDPNKVNFFVDDDGDTFFEARDLDVSA